MGDSSSSPAAPSEAAIKARVISHMNKDHGPELELFLRAFNGVPAAAAAGAQLLDMTLDEMTIGTDAGVAHFVAISPPLPSLGASRARLVDMTNEALARLGLSDVRIDAFAPPAPADWAVALAVAFYFFAAATRGLVRPGTGAWALLDAVFPFGAEGYRWIVKAIFVPVLAIHVTEAWWMGRTRLAKHRVPRGGAAWWLWTVATFFEGVMAFRRFDRVVEAERAKKAAAKH